MRAVAMAVKEGTARAIQLLAEQAAMVDLAVAQMDT
jgi:hypothetical protein